MENKEHASTELTKSERANQTRAFNRKRQEERRAARDEWERQYCAVLWGLIHDTDITAQIRGELVTIYEKLRPVCPVIPV